MIRELSFIALLSLLTLGSAMASNPMTENDLYPAGGIYRDTYMEKSGCAWLVFPSVEKRKIQIVSVNDPTREKTKRCTAEKKFEDTYSCAQLSAARFLHISIAVN